MKSHFIHEISKNRREWREEEKKKRKRRERRERREEYEWWEEEQRDELKEETEGCVNKQPNGQKRVDTAKEVWGEEGEGEGRPMG